MTRDKNKFCDDNLPKDAVYCSNRAPLGGSV
jgi:hypothetical protein